MIRQDCPTDSVLDSGVAIDPGLVNPGNRGFTLIELMIVVGIVGILAAIAYPSYEWALQRSRKTEARTNLTSLTLLLEQHRALYGCYGKRTGVVCPTVETDYAYEEDDGGTATTDTITSWLNFNPRVATEVEATEGIRYDYSIKAKDQLTPPGFEVKATPVTSRGAKAGNLTITQAGAKTGWN